MEKGIELEREKLAFLKKEADQVIDTSRLLTKELRHELCLLYTSLSIIHQKRHFEQ